MRSATPGWIVPLSGPMMVTQDPWSWLGTAPSTGATWRLFPLWFPVLSDTPTIPWATECPSQGEVTAWP